MLSSICLAAPLLCLYLCSFQKKEQTSSHLFALQPLLCLTHSPHAPQTLKAVSAPSLTDLDTIVLRLVHILFPFYSRWSILVNLGKKSLFEVFWYPWQDTRPDLFSRPAVADWRRSAGGEAGGGGGGGGGGPGNHRHAGTGEIAVSVLEPDTKSDTCL